MAIEKSFKMHVIVMPACSGKTTLHLERNNIIDAGSICEKSIVRANRTIARESGDWETFDDWWAAQILSQLDTDKIVLLVPSVEIAKRVSYKTPSVFVIELTEWIRVLELNEHRNMDNARRSYTEAIFDETCEQFGSHELLRQEIIKVAALVRTANILGD